LRRQALIVGTGGHCRVILSVLASCDAHDVVGIVDLGTPRSGEVIMGISEIRSSSWLEEFRGQTNVDVFLAIGNNELRRTWWEKFQGFGLPLPNLISPHAIVDSHAHLGESNVVCARAFIGPEAILGDNNLVNTGAVLEHEVRLGSHCHVAPLSLLAGRSRVDDNSFIGAGAIVINDISVAANITVGAGGTVIRNIADPGGVYVGVPARKANSA